MGVDGIAAGRTLLSYRNIQAGMCLHYVWQAYKAHGASVSGSWPTAYAAWLSTPGKHPGDRNPPAGVPVWWGRRNGDGGTPNDRAGDVVISLGGGRVACTDYPGWSQTGSCTIAERERQIGRPYLGWTETILGYPIDQAQPASGGNATPFPQEDDMAFDAAEKQHLDIIAENIVQAVAARLPVQVWGFQIDAQTPDGRNAGVKYPAAGFLASTSATALAARTDISNISAGAVDVPSLAAELRDALAPDIVKALGTALLNG